MNLWIERHCPPGSNGKGHILGFLIVSCLCSVYMTFYFCQAYYFSYHHLFIEVLGQPVLDPNATMPDFASLHAPILLFLLPLVLGALSRPSFYHSTYYQGSKSIYLMRRLPDPWERWRLCLTLPALSLLLIVLVLGVMLLLTFAIYLFFTPESALTPHQLQKFWAYHFPQLSDLVKIGFLGGMYYD